MKKLGFAISILVLVIASVIFYLNDQEQKQMVAINQLQDKVTLQLNHMQKNGFSVTQREIQKEKEHFFIAISEPEKASTYLTQMGIRMTTQEAEEYKDLKLSVTLQYLSDIYSLDIWNNLKIARCDQNDTLCYRRIQGICAGPVVFPLWHVPCLCMPYLNFA